MSSISDNHEGQGIREKKGQSRMRIVKSLGRLERQLPIAAEATHYYKKY